MPKPIIKYKRRRPKVEILKLGEWLNKGDSKVVSFSLGKEGGSYSILSVSKNPSDTILKKPTSLPEEKQPKKETEYTRVIIIKLAKGDSVRIEEGKSHTQCTLQKALPTRWRRLKLPKLRQIK